MGRKGRFRRLAPWWRRRPAPLGWRRPRGMRSAPVARHFARPAEAWSARWRPRRSFRPAPLPSARPVRLRSFRPGARPSARPVRGDSCLRHPPRPARQPLPAPETEAPTGWPASGQPWTGAQAPAGRPSPDPALAGVPAPSADLADPDAVGEPQARPSADLADRARVRAPRARPGPVLPIGGRAVVAAPPPPTIGGRAAMAASEPPTIGSGGGCSAPGGVQPGSACGGCATAADHRGSPGGAQPGAEGDGPGGGQAVITPGAGSQAGAGSLVAASRNWTRARRRTAMTATIAPAAPATQPAVISHTPVEDPPTPK